MTQRLPYGVLGGVLLAGVSLLLSACPGTQRGLTSPSGYRVTLPSTAQTRRFHPLALTVQVHDAAGKPVDDVPVSFQVPTSWATQAALDPPTVVTRAGQATTTLHARTAGQLAVSITVEDQTVPVSVTILGDAPRF